MPLLSDANYRLGGLKVYKRDETVATVAKNKVRDTAYHITVLAYMVTEQVEEVLENKEDQEFDMGDN